MPNPAVNSVFFYCPTPVSLEQRVYCHSIVCLAEGLQALGVDCFANRNYWQLDAETNQYLLPFDPEVTPNDCDIVVTDSDWFVAHSDLPSGLFNNTRKYITVYFERAADAIHLPINAWQSEFRNFDFVFRSHYNQRFTYPSNFYPWAIGCSNRVLSKTGSLVDYEERKKTILVNFRLAHPLREQVKKDFLPLIEDVFAVDSTVDESEPQGFGALDYLYWQQTAMRHYPGFYQRLMDSAACACFGGLFINPWPLDAYGPTKLWDRIINKLLLKFSPNPPRLMNWDSFRFWESLAAGCLTFHVDLAKYGAVLPVMPGNWEHYIGIDWDDIDATVLRIRSEPETLAKVANQGRAWAIENYSPEPLARRFLQVLASGNKPSN